MMDEDMRLRSLLDAEAGGGPDSEQALIELGPRFAAARRRRQAGQVTLFMGGLVVVAGLGAVLVRPQPTTTLEVSPADSTTTIVTLATTTSSTTTVVTTPTTQAPVTVTTSPVPVETVTSAAPVETTAAPPPTAPPATSRTTRATTPPSIERITTTTAPTASVPVAPAPTPPASTGSTTATSDDRAKAAPADGPYSVSCAGGSVTVVAEDGEFGDPSVTAAPGWRLAEEDAEDDRVDVRWRSGNRESRARIEINDGTVRTSCND